MVKMISLKCPDCGAVLSIEEGRKQCFCQFCGAKIVMDDGSTTNIYRDEARIKEAEVNEQIRLKELELELSDRQQKKQTLKIKIIVSIVLAVIGGLFMLLSDVNETAGILGFGCLVALLWVWVGGLISNDK